VLFEFHSQRRHGLHLVFIPFLNLESHHFLEYSLSHRICLLPLLSTKSIKTSILSVLQAIPIPLPASFAIHQGAKLCQNEVNENEI
jgi:hypothetical protein